MRTEHFQPFVGLVRSPYILDLSLVIRLKASQDGRREENTGQDCHRVLISEISKGDSRAWDNIESPDFNVGNVESNRHTKQNAVGQPQSFHNPLPSQPNRTQNNWKGCHTIHNFSDS